jgi:DNA-binding MarR family transcriptional regulator
MPSSYRAYFSSIVALETTLWNAVDRRITGEGAIRLGRLEYLRVLRSEGNARVQDVADHLGITVGAASKLTDRLVSDGLVQREAHPTDRRSSHLHLTEAGVAALDVGEAAFETAISALLGGLDRAVVAEGIASLEAARVTVLRAEVAR